jgi:Histone-binding protein RBBP4 or subunit C of CAF1 complex
VKERECSGTELDERSIDGCLWPPTSLRSLNTQVWQPGDDDVEDLEYDPSAYDCLHAFQLEWPCLRCVDLACSCDFLHRSRRCLHACISAWISCATSLASVELSFRIPCTLSRARKQTMLVAT